MSRFLVSEQFCSIQGEGGWLGVPSYFLRLSGCNLRCVWCDTPYASWNPDGVECTMEEIIGKIDESGMRHVVITGGEPMLPAAIVPLTHELHSQGKVITIETAGTIHRDVACDLMSISPKLKHSAPPLDTPGGWHARHERTRIQPEVLRLLIANFAVQIKFVVSETDLSDQVEEIESLLAQLPQVEPDQVLLMAEGVVGTSIQANQRCLVPICLQKGWRMSPRFQIDLFGNRRGT